MTLEKREPELDLESEGVGKAATYKLLVPVHADNFALALAAGYVGGSLKVDAAEDLQSHVNDSLTGFVDEVPAWAISEGEPGDRVILAFARTGVDAPRAGSIEMLDGPSRVTSLEAAYFRDEAAIANFSASYDAFPDVPAGLVRLSSNWPVRDAGDRPADFHRRTGDASRRRELDFLGGFAAGIVELLAEGAFDGPLWQFLGNPGRGAAENARNLLLSMEPNSASVDIAIWTATIDALWARFGNRGFDRREFLADLGQRLADVGPEAESWLRGCRKIIDAEIDLPELPDGDKAGRRAALVVILSHEPSGLESLEDDLEAGPRVRALVTAAVYAFAGLSRIDRKLKSPAARMDAVLETGERLASGEPVPVALETTGTGPDLARQQVIEVGGYKAVERRLEPPAYLVMLKARIQEAGYKVELDKHSGMLAIRAGGSRGGLIFVEDCPRSESGNPVVNLVLPISKLGARPTTASLKGLLAAAWENATTVALRNTREAEEVVAVASLPLATLDRDELNFHVERLLRVSACLGGKGSKGHRVKK